MAVEVTMAGRKVVDASNAQFCLAAAAASGLSGRDWAHENGVDARSLHVWRMILGRKWAGGGAPIVLPVELVEAEKALAPPTGSPIRVCRGLFMAELVGDVDELLLERGDQSADHRVPSLPDRVRIDMAAEHPWQGGSRWKGRLVSLTCGGGVG